MNLSKKVWFLMLITATSNFLYAQLISQDSRGKDVLEFYQARALNGKPMKTNSALAQGFGIGIDWLKKKGKWSSGNYFIYGSLNLSFFDKIRIAIRDS